MQWLALHGLEMDGLELLTSHGIAADGHFHPLQMDEQVKEIPSHQLEGDDFLALL